jgi:hypothetical protein
LSVTFFSQRERDRVTGHLSIPKICRTYVVCVCVCVCVI